MDEMQLVDYMKTHGGFALIGKEDTLESAQSLEKRGMVVKVGDDPETKQPVYRLSAEAIASMGKKGQKSLVKQAADFLIDWKTAMEDGSSGDLDRAGSLTLGGSDIAGLGLGPAPAKKKEDEKK